MAEKKKPQPKFNTPIGVARYPHLNKPDTRFKDEGVYKCDVILEDDDVTTELVEYLTGLRDEAYDACEKKSKIKADIVSPELDDAGDETGRVVLKTKLNASGKRKDGTEWAESPKLFDSQGNPLASDIQVWSGSKLIVAGTARPYAMTDKMLVDGKQKTVTTVGVTCYCRGVQIIELVNGSEQNAESFGFGAQDGGYIGQAAQAGLGAAAPESNDSPPAGDDDGDEDEF